MRAQQSTPINPFNCQVYMSLVKEAIDIKNPPPTITQTNVHTNHHFQLRPKPKINELIISPTNSKTKSRTNYSRYTLQILEQYESKGYYSDRCKKYMKQKVSAVRQNFKRKQTNIHDLLSLFCTQCFRAFWLRYFNFKDFIKEIKSKADMKIQKRLFYILYLPRIRYWIDSFEYVEQTEALYRIRNQYGGLINRTQQIKKPRLLFRKYDRLSIAQAIYYCSDLKQFLEDMLEQQHINQKLIRQTYKFIQEMANFVDKNQSIKKLTPSNQQDKIVCLRIIHPLQQLPSYNLLQNINLPLNKNQSRQNTLNSLQNPNDEQNEINNQSKIAQENYNQDVIDQEGANIQSEIVQENNIQDEIMGFDIYLEDSHLYWKACSLKFSPIQNFYTRFFTSDPGFIAQTNCIKKESKEHQLEMKQEDNNTIRYKE